MRAGFTVFFLALFVGAMTYIAFERKELRDGRAINLASLSEDDAVSAIALDRSQDASVVAGYVDSKYFRNPKVGLIGNHQAAFMTTRSLCERPDCSRFFFNYWYIDMGLPELSAYVRYLGRRDRLPRDLAVIQITTPNNDNGRHIIDTSGMISPIIAFDAIGESRSLINEISWLTKVVTLKVRESFDYMALLSFAASRDNQVRVVNVKECEKYWTEGREPATVTLFGFTFITSIGLFQPDGIFYVSADKTERDFCRKGILNLQRRWDGSSVASVQIRPTLNEMTFQAGEAGLTFGDEVKIAEYMVDIRDYLSAQGVQAVFYIPPVYETNRDSVANDIMSMALKRVPDLDIIDHRGLRLDMQYFVDYDHPSELYYSEYFRPELNKRLDRMLASDAGGT